VEEEEEEKETETWIETGEKGDASYAEEKVTKPQTVLTRMNKEEEEIQDLDQAATDLELDIDQEETAEKTDVEEEIREEQEDTVEIEVTPETEGEVIEIEEVHQEADHHLKEVVADSTKAKEIMVNNQDLHQDVMQDEEAQKADQDLLEGTEQEKDPLKITDREIEILKEVATINKDPLEVISEMNLDLDLKNYLKDLKDSVTKKALKIKEPMAK